MLRRRFTRSVRRSRSRRRLVASGRHLAPGRSSHHRSLRQGTSPVPWHRLQECALDLDRGHRQPPSQHAVSNVSRPCSIGACSGTPRRRRPRLPRLPRERPAGRSLTGEVSTSDLRHLLDHRRQGFTRARHTRPPDGPRRRQHSKLVVLRFAASGTALHRDRHDVPTHLRPMLAYLIDSALADAKAFVAPCALGAVLRACPLPRGRIRRCSGSASSRVPRDSSATPSSRLGPSVGRQASACST